jgi:hypothetical protein
MKPVVDGFIVVSLEEIRNAMRLMAEKARVISEGAGALPLAAALTGKAGPGPIVGIVSGGNIDLKKFSELIELIRSRSPRSRRDKRLRVIPGGSGLGSRTFGSFCGSVLTAGPLPLARFISGFPRIQPPREVSSHLWSANLQRGERVLPHAAGQWQWCCKKNRLRTPWPDRWLLDAFRALKHPAVEKLTGSKADCAWDALEAAGAQP